MAETRKHFKRRKKKRKTATLKCKNTVTKCPIGLKPFEVKFSKSVNKNQDIINRKRFAKQLLSQFAPNSIKPEDNFYDYINYQWLKDVSLEQQQKYIVQIDNFRLAQDKVYGELNGIILDYVKNNNNTLAKNLKNYYTSVVEMNPKPYSRRLAREAETTIEKFFAKTLFAPKLI